MVGITKRIDQIQELQKQGMTLKEMAALWGITAHSVYCYIWNSRNPLRRQRQDKGHYQRNKERICKYERDRYILKKIYLTRLGTNGKTIYGLSKRERPDSCELCGKRRKRLVYHHWDESNLNIGLWICGGACHSFAEKVDAGFVEKYLELKKSIETEIRAPLVALLPMGRNAWDE